MKPIQIEMSEHEYHALWAAIETRLEVIHKSIKEVSTQSLEWIYLYRQMQTLLKLNEKLSESYYGKELYAQMKQEA